MYGLVGLCLVQVVADQSGAVTVLFPVPQDPVRAGTLAFDPGLDNLEPMIEILNTCLRQALSGDRQGFFKNDLLERQCTAVDPVNMM